jgi:hypothetical protein
MKPTVQTIFAKQDDVKAISEFLRQIPEGQQFRFELAPGRQYRNEGYARASMTGYYLHADGEIAQCLIITSIFAYQHERIADHYNGRQSGHSMIELKDDVERLLE